MRLKLALFLATISTLTLIGASVAATPLRTAPPRPNQVSQTPPPKMPISKKVVKQAKQQVEGEFGSFSRSRVGGQIQPAWDEADNTEGFYQYTECTDCVYKVRVREFMVTTIILPKGLQIHSFDVGDKAEFTVEKRADNMLAVQPSGGGVDTNLTVLTTEGDVFPFYIRAENFNSTNVPDVIVKINGNRLPKTPILKTVVDPVEATTASQENGEKSPKTAEDKKAGTKTDAALEGLQKKAGTSSSSPYDFIENAAFNPDRLRGFDEYELWGDEELEPEMVFRDDHFTYIKFGDKWSDLDLPVAYVVVDGIDELVNTRVQGTTFIIESTKRLISLKAGKKFLCIKYEGEA